MLTLAAFLLLPLACGDGDDDTGVEAELVYTDDHNYAYEAALEVDTVVVQYAGDVTVDWSALTRDLRGRPLDPSEVDRATLIAFSLPKEDVLASINDNSLSQSDIRDYREFDNGAGGTSAAFSQFSILGNTFLPESEFIEGEGTWTWAVALWKESDGREEILSTLFVDPDPASDVLRASFTDDTGSLSFEVDLHSATPLSAPSGTGSIAFDWSAATVEASGQPFDTANGDRLLLGHVADATVTDVEAGFLTVLESADELYQADTYGLTRIDLSGATERSSGAAFGGFTADGVWLIGIECTTCTSPAPLILSVVEVVD